MRRSLHELVFRLKQETGNLRLLLSADSLAAEQPSPLAGLPDPRPVVEALRGTAFAARIEHLAGLVLQHRFPFLGFEVSTGPEIRWRRDYVNCKESGVAYFRLIPYLDFSHAGDHKVVWELNRHQHLVLLAQAWRLTRRQEFLEEVVRQVDGWLVDNPYLRGINWASALEVAFRALSWTWVYHLAGADMTAAFRRKLLAGIRQHGRYIERNLSIYFSPNTHLLGEAVVLHSLGALFHSFPEAARWRRLGAEIVSAQMESQVRDDGTHFEQSSWYHLYALDMFLFHRLLSETTPEYDETLRRMARYAAALAGPARSLPFLGDEDGGRLFHPYGDRGRFSRSTLATCAQILADCDWLWSEEDLHEQAIWWLGPHRLGSAPARPAPGAQSGLFPQAGVAVLAAGDVQVIIDAGPLGAGSAGHSHADCLSVIARLGGEEILTDAGTFTYVGGSGRDWFRGTSAHNTVRIDGRNQATPAGAFRWTNKPDVSIRQWSSSATSDWLDAECCDAGFVHRRRLFFLKPDILFVLDEVSGLPGEHDIEQFWHFARPAVEAASGIYRIGARSYLAISPDESAGFGEGGEHGWRSPVYGQKAPASFLRVHRRSALPVSLWAVLDFSGDPDSGLQVEADAACVYRRGAQSWRLRFPPVGPPAIDCH